MWNFQGWNDVCKIIAILLWPQYVDWKDRNILRFQFKMGFGWIFHITQGPSIDPFTLHARKYAHSSYCLVLCCVDLTHNLQGCCTDVGASSCPDCASAIEAMRNNMANKTTWDHEELGFNCSKTLCMFYGMYWKQNFMHVFLWYTVNCMIIGLFIFDPEIGICTKAFNHASHKAVVQH